MVGRRVCCSSGGGIPPNLAHHTALLVAAAVLVEDRQAGLLLQANLSVAAWQAQKLQMRGGPAVKRGGTST